MRGNALLQSFIFFLVCLQFYAHSRFLCWIRCCCVCSILSISPFAFIFFVAPLRLGVGVLFHFDTYYFAIVEEPHHCCHLYASFFFFQCVTSFGLGFSIVVCCCVYAAFFVRSCAFFFPFRFMLPTTSARFSFCCLYYFQCVAIFC